MNEAFIERLRASGLSMYGLAAGTGIPYTTINRLVHGRLDINRISAESLYRISVVLCTKSEELLNPVQIMDNATGHYGKIKYRWICNGKDAPYIAFLHNGMTVTIDMEDEFNRADERRYYDYFAQMAIERYIKRAEFEESIKENVDAEVLSEAQR